MSQNVCIVLISSLELKTEYLCMSAEKAIVRRLLFVWWREFDGFQYLNFSKVIVTLFKPFPLFSKTNISLLKNLIFSPWGIRTEMGHNGSCIHVFMYISPFIFQNLVWYFLKLSRLYSDCFKRTFLSLLKTPKLCLSKNHS